MSQKWVGSVVATLRHAFVEELRKADFEPDTVFVSGLEYLPSQNMVRILIPLPGYLIMDMRSLTFAGVPPGGRGEDHFGGGDSPV